MATETGANFSTQDLYNEIYEQMGFEEEAEQAKPQPENPEAQSEEEVTTEEPTEEEDVSEETEETPVDEEAPWIPESFEELAEAMKVDPDALKAIKVKTKVDGVESEVPLGEVLKNYQINKSLTERSEALAHMRKDFEARQAQFQQATQEQLANWNAWNQILEQRLREQVGAIDWQQLREDDPAEYAARRQEFTERIGEIESMKHSLVQEQQRQVQALQMQQIQGFQQAVEANIARLPELIPEYKNKEVLKKEMSDIKTYLTEFGFVPEEINSIYDARHVAIARKAMLYDKMQAKAEPKQKLLKEKPKFVKPTARTSPDVEKRTENDRAYKRALKSQHTDDWAEVILNRL